MNDLHVTWTQYHRLIERLAVKVYDSAWDFDAIVCLARGGLRIGDVFSRLFDRPLGVLFTSSYREDAGTVRSRLVISEHVSSARPLPGGRWLLVDDLVDSGVTMQEVVPVLRSRFPEVLELRVAVLWQKGTSVARPDYCVDYLPTSPWIHQPFEEYDRIGPAALKARLEGEAESR